MQTLKLLLSVLISSWQFFKETVPSPRIEFALHSNAEGQSSNWQEFSLRPERRSAGSVLKSIFFNPAWNEALFIMDCAERLIINQTDYYSQEIMKRIIAELKRRELDLSLTPYLQFRLVFISRKGDELGEDILYISKAEKIFGESEL